MLAINNWVAQNSDDAKHIGTIEFKHPIEDDEYVTFEILQTTTHLLFGGACNVGFLESGNQQLNPSLSFDENLQKLIENLMNYYTGKTNFSEDFACNERM